MRRFTLLTLIALLMLPILSPLLVTNTVYAETIAASDDERVKKYYVSELVRLCFSNDQGETLETSVKKSKSGKPHDFTFNRTECDKKVNDLVEKVAPGVTPANFFKLGDKGFKLNPKNERYELKPTSKAKQPGTLAQAVYDVYTNGKKVSANDVDVKAGGALASINQQCKSVNKIGTVKSLQSGSDDQKIQYERAKSGKENYIIGNEIENNVTVPYVYKYESKTYQGSAGATYSNCKGAIAALSTARSQMVAKAAADLLDKKYDAFMSKLQQDICRDYPGVPVAGGGVNEGVLNTCRENVKKYYESCITTAAVRPGGPSAQGGKIISSSQAAIDCVANKMILDVPRSERDRLRNAITSAFQQAQKSADGIKQDTIINSGDTSEDDNAVDPASTCNIDGLGFAICPVVRFLAGITDAAYGYVTAMLYVPSRVIFNPDANAQGSLYEPWSIMRNIANVAFVIAFMVIIYSQVTSMGVSNYGIKKMLPRIIVAALLVNGSFWIAGIAVDLSNIVGESIYRVFGGFNLYNDSGAINTGSLSMTTLGDIALLGAGVAGAGVAVGSGLLSISIFLPMILAAVLAILLTVFILTLRQAFIIGLVVIAPLAFVAYLLPNTEDWFKRWWSVFRTLLILFPVIALIFSVSRLASQVLTAVSNSPAYANNDTLRFVMQVMAAGVQILPLFLTTILTNITQGVLGKVTGIVNNKEKGLIDRSKNLRRDRQKYRNQQTLAGYGRGNKKGSKANPLTWGRKGAGRIGRGFDSRRRSREANMKTADNEVEANWRGSDPSKLGGEGGKAALRRLDGSEATLQKVKVDGEIENLEYNKKLHIDANISQLGLDAGKQQVGDDVADTVLTSSDAARRAGSFMEGGTERAIDFAQARKDKRTEELITNAQSRMGTDDIGDLFQTLTNESQSKEVRAAAGRRITEVGGDQHVEEMVDYMARNKSSKDMSEIQIFTAERALKRKSAAWGSTDYSAMARGELDKSWNTAMLDQLGRGKIGATELLAMPQDDRVRLAELAKTNPKAMEPHIESLNEAMHEIRTNDIMKKQLTPQMDQVFNDISAGTGATTRLQNMDFDQDMIKNNTGRGGGGKNPAPSGQQQQASGSSPRRAAPADTSSASSNDGNLTIPRPQRAQQADDTSFQRPGSPPARDDSNFARPQTPQTPQSPQTQPPAPSPSQPSTPPPPPLPNDSPFQQPQTPPSQSDTRPSWPGNTPDDPGLRF